MGMLFSDLSKVLSVKSCYSKLLFSSAVFMLMLLLCAAFFVQELPGIDGNQNSSAETALLD